MLGTVASLSSIVGVETQYSPQSSSQFLYLASGLDVRASEGIKKEHFDHVPIPYNPDN